MPDNKKAKTSEINFKIHLDEDKIPEKIEWSATDSNAKELREAKAFLISIWDKRENISMRLDLWTKEMQVDEMNDFFFQAFMTMADTYERATGNTDLVQKIKSFGKEFSQEAKKSGK